MDPELKKVVDDMSTSFKRPDNPSQYIRTYAKDVAGLTGTPAPIIAHPQNPAKTIPPSVLVSQTEEDTVREIEANRVSEKEKETTTISLDDDEVLGTTATPVTLAPAPAPPVFVQPVSPPAPVMPPADVVETVVAEKETPEDREAVLARLRAKFAPAVAQSYILNHPELASERSVPVMPAPAVAPLPAETQVPEIPTLPAREEAIVAPAAVAPTKLFAPEPTPIAPVPVPFSGNRSSLEGSNTPTESPLHTYKSDFADRIDKKQSSTFSVLAAQSDAAPLPAQVQKKNLLLPTLAGVFFLLLSISGIVGTYWYLQKNQVPMATPGIPSLIFADKKVEVRGSGNALLESLAGVASDSIPEGQLAVTYTTASDSGTPLQGGALIRALPLNAPDILLRNIADTSTVGVIHAGTETRAFFILRVTSYPRSLAGMLVWEKTLLQDLSILYPSEVSDLTFTDSVVANRDVRIAKDAKGTIVALYGYLDKETLIIARDGMAFTALVTRLGATNTQ